MPESANPAGGRGLRRAPPGLHRALEGSLPFRTLPEQIAAKIRQAILAGQLPPGARLVESEIAQRVRTSRGPVRDALALLERDGLVSKLPNRGACVLDFSERTLREAASLRALLEEFAVSQAVRRLTPGDLDELQSLIQGMEEAARLRAPEKFNELDYRFHDRILEASGHQILRETWRGMQRRIRAFVASTNLANDDLRAVARRHRAIFQGLASRRLAESRRAMRAHFARLEEEIEFLLAARGPETSAARSGSRPGRAAPSRRPGSR
jgi:DNA-binding GntR family transcriptional regulator